MAWPQVHVIGGVHCDTTLPQLTWKRTPPDHQARWCGLLCVYVDDLLFCGEQGALDKALQAVDSKWSCAPAEWASESKALKFCGMEITVDKDGDGLHLTQSGYEKEILERWPTERGSDFPL